MGLVRQGIGIVALLGVLGVSAAVLAAPEDKLADKARIGPSTTLAVDFGDDASAFANDGECDDPRFSGAGAAKRPDPADLGHDAADCSAALTAGTVVFNGGGLAPAIDFGDDSSSYANNGECDDPRFEGQGTASVLLDNDRMRDATDCRTLFEGGTISIIAVFAPGYAAGAPYDASGITFGDDASDYANNDVCDDPRFMGPGVASVLLDSDLLHDATDCEASLVAGTVILKADAEANPETYVSDLDPSINFGDNTGSYIDDGECDDPRFEGPGAANVTGHGGRLSDARDCRDLFDSGEITLLAVFGPDYAAGAPYDSTGVDFGDNSSDYADNDECDDPRFIGPGMASILLDSDRGHDSADCRASFEAGTVVLRVGEEGAAVEAASYPSTLDPSLDFGDNTSSYADNDECDDPRFTGENMASVLVDSDRLHDARDCVALFDAGRITLLAVFGPDYAAGAPYDSTGIDFGDDTSSYANNSECDDPRFTGPGLASIVIESDTLHDATDCRGAFEAGLVMLKPDTATTTTTMSDPPIEAGAGIDFGDDASAYANDGECDDPRFAGTGMASALADNDLLHDATDCRALVESGSIVFLAVYGPDYAGGAPYDTAGIDFGDDTGAYANNGECDDPRFAGPGMAGVLQEADTLRDATDCTAQFAAGQVALRDAAAVAPPPADLSGIDFGDDASSYANNDECDDYRFVGDAMDLVLLDSDVGHDATDCRTLAEAGRIVFQQVFASDYASGAPYDPAGIDFGDDASSFANNDECDDSRFAGPAMAGFLIDNDIGHDATDCEAKFVAGLVALKG